MYNNEENNEGIAYGCGNSSKKEITEKLYGKKPNIFVRFWKWLKSLL